MKRAFRTRTRGTRRQIGKKFPIMIASSRGLATKLPKSKPSVRILRLGKLTKVKEMLKEITKLDKKDQELFDKIEDIESQFDIGEYHDLKYEQKNINEKEYELRKKIKKEFSKLDKYEKAYLRNLANSRDWYIPS